ncbi:Ala-tRNA(Pro) deacylase [Clostridiales Family XIII bacterium PM5-7]
MREQRLYELLETLEIRDYEVHEHAAIASTQEADELGIKMEGMNLKNLLIKDKKAGRFFLVILDDHRHMEQKEFKAVTGWGKIRFANAEEMWELLKLKPGEVSPFGLMEDEEKRITVVLEKMITHAGEDELVNFHPYRNTATLSMKKKDFLRFLTHLGNPVIFEE